MNDYEQKIKQIIDTIPSWEKDGGGIRGRTIAPLIGGASGPNLMGDPIPQQFSQQRSGLIQQQDDPLPTLSLPASGGVLSSSLIHPWQILLRVVPESDPPEYEFKVELNSRLYSGLSSWSNIEITDIGTWKEVSLGYVVLFGVVDGGVCTEASIEIQETLSDRMDFVDGSQTSFATQLGYLYQEGDAWIVRQNAFHNFTLVDTCVSGVSAIYPIAT